MQSPALLFGLSPIFMAIGLSAAERFTIATWNLDNYLDEPTPQRRAKTPISKAAVHETLRDLRADVIALQEMGSTNSLSELRDTLHCLGLDYPYWEHLHARDEEVHLAVLSRFPIIARRPHTNDTFLLNDRRFFVRRGFAEIDIRVGTNYQFTLITAHLKSKRRDAHADEAMLRLEEARCLRRKADALLNARADANFVLIGDFNDIVDSPPLRVLLGHGSRALFDTCPRELVSGNTSSLQAPTWTYHYDRRQSIERVDYILLSPGMKREWLPEGTHIHARKDWRIASDHRPILSMFTAENR
jgi:endonuclease/exonuclease/phosphatase family metal-dependent hydrolase